MVKNMKNKKILLGMIIINLISMILGFLRDSSIAFSLGATAISDVFMFITNLPTVLFSALGWVIMSTFVPTYTEVMVNQSEEKLNKFSNTFIKSIAIISGAITIILIVFNKIFIHILAPGFKGEYFILTQKLFFIIIPALIFLSIASCIAAILNANKKMIYVSLLGIPINITTIIGILFVYPKHGLELTTFIVLLGSILQILIFINPLRKTGFKFTKDFNLRDENIKKLISIIGPMLIGVMAQQINVLFGGAITSTLSKGSLTSYNLATKIVNATYNSIILIGISYIFPYLSHDFASGKIEVFKEKVSKSINIIFLILMPINILLIQLNDEVISILYGYGSFSRDAIQLTSNILLFLSIGVVFMGIRELINRAYYSAKNTKIPMKYSVLGISINIILGLLLAKRFGVIGVAIASSLSILLSTFAICFKFKKDFGVKFIKQKDLLKYVFITVILFYITKFTHSFISMSVNSIATIIITSLITTIGYFILIYIFKVDIKSYLKSF